MAQFPNNFINYVKGSYEELHKVTWPTTNKAVRLTILVLIFVVVSSLFLLSLDHIFGYAYDTFILGQ